MYEISYMNYETNFGSRKKQEYKFDIILNQAETNKALLSKEYLIHIELVNIIIGW